jgi:chaperonin GroES
MTSIKPIKTKILIQPDYTEFASEGGIIVPDSLKTRCNRGKVVAVGEGSKEVPMEYAPNYTVWHTKGAGVEVIDNGITYVILDTADRSLIKGYLKD